MTTISTETSAGAVRPRFARRGVDILILFAVALLALFGPEWLRAAPDSAASPVVDWVDRGLNWFAREATIGGVAIQEITRGFAAAMEWPIDQAKIVLADGIWSGRGLNRAQAIPPLSWLAIGGVAVIAGFWFGGRGLAIAIAIGVAYLVVFGLWTNAMITLSSVLISTVLAVALGVALGVWSYRSARAEAGVRALMNVMQTVPIFAYLIPTLLLFGYGPSAALIATVVYALPPMVHNTVLALRAVPSEVVEAGRIAGCTDRQLLWKVQLPTALPALSTGLNQVVMMSLNMVIIASMIGAGGLGYDVLTALRKLDIGIGLEAGMAIVVLAVILDRLSQAAAQQGASGVRRARWPLWGVLLAWIIVATGLAVLVPALQAWPKDWNLSTAAYWNDLISWINLVAFDAIEAFRTVALLHVMRPFQEMLIATPWALIVAAIALVGAALGGVRLAAQTAGLTLFIVATGFWEPAMSSVYLTTIAVALALVIGFPIGAALALTPKLQPGARLVLDTLQTLPTLVYLLPAVMLFRIGDVSAVIAVTSYALAPAVRYAMEGLSRVPPERLEAAAIAGCTRWQTMRMVRLPTAAPTLLLGVNQTIMMALSMLVIAALVGTKDLGQEVLVALNQSKTGQGVVAGLCVAALALIADAVLKAWAAKAAAREGGT